MTDETDHSQADSGRDSDEKRNAEVKATSGPDDDPDVFLVKYPDGSVEYEPGTPRNQALFGEGLYNKIDGVTTFEHLDKPIGVEANVSDDYYSIIRDGTQVRVPSEYVDDLVDAFRGAHTAEELYEVYTDIIEGQVRRGVISEFLARFPDDRVEPTADGWEIDDTFIVTYEATNHLLNIDPVDPYTDSVHDGSKQAVYLDLQPDGDREVRTPQGEKRNLTEIEQEFLVTVEGLLYPEDYFGVELVDEIQQHKASDDTVGDLIEDMAGESEVTGYTDSKTGNHHGSVDHSFGKHKLQYEGVTDEVDDLLWSHGYDHAGVHEVLMRKDELVGRDDIDVFEDAPDDDQGKWDRLRSIADGAPIHPNTREKLEEMYGSR